MKVRALRGVCIGVDRHLKPGDIADVDAGTLTFLVGIRAVEVVPDEPKPKPTEVVPDEPKFTKPTLPDKTGKKE